MGGLFFFSLLAIEIYFAAILNDLPTRYGFAFFSLSGGIQIH